jgi:hypothetical protein
MSKEHDGFSWFVSVYINFQLLERNGRFQHVRRKKCVYVRKKSSARAKRFAYIYPTFKWQVDEERYSSGVCMK